MKKFRLKNIRNIRQMDLPNEIEVVFTFDAVSSLDWSRAIKFRKDDKMDLVASKLGQLADDLLRDFEQLERAK